jgi:hypothetical protein
VGGLLRQTSRPPWFLACLDSRHADGPRKFRFSRTGCSAAWLARLLWEQEAAGSNPAIPTALRAKAAAVTGWIAPAAQSVAQIGLGFASSRCVWLRSCVPVGNQTQLAWHSDVSTQG